MKIFFSRFWFLIFGFFLFFAIPNFTNAAYLASDLLGQLDVDGNPVYTSNTINNGEGVVNPRGFNGGVDVTLDKVHHRLFFDDNANRRVVVFNLDEHNNLIDRVADFVIGQADFATGTASLSINAGTFHTNGPQCSAYDSVHDRLFVCDVSNNRVLVFDTSVITNGMDASYVLGQTLFSTNSSALTQNGVNTPIGAVYDPENDRLFVQERFNSRVLVYNVAPGTIANGMNASYVLGQPDFTTNTPATTQNRLAGTRSGLEYDSENTLLFVVSPDDRRVMVYDVAPGTIVNGMNASYVLGQSLFTTNTSAVTQSGFGAPRGVAFDPVNKNLFVLDATGRRILIHNVSLSTITNGQNATAVIGQANFTSSTSGVTQGLFAGPFGSMAYDSGNNRLYAVDNSSNRILVFNFVKLSIATPVNEYTGNTYSYTLSSTQYQGTVSYAITSGSLPTGLSLNSSTGEISGTPTVAGTYNFTVQATDDNGAIGSFVSQPQEYTLTIEEKPVTSGSRPANSYRNIQPILIEPTEPVSVIPKSETSQSTTTQYTFTRNLKLKDTGEDVKELQKYLNTHGYPVAITGQGLPAQAGSLGNETNYFGTKTKTALIKFQLANMLRGDGIFGPLTRAMLSNKN